MPEYANGLSLHVSESWHEAVDSEEASTGVSKHQRSEIYPALRLHTLPEANVAMMAKFLIMLSIKEFMAAIATTRRRVQRD